ncbi:MAG: hypothetical protein R2812_01285 [Gelidibacter sp.]
MKKLFSAIAIMLFMGSSLNANVVESSNKENSDDCWSQVQTFVLQAERAGKSLEELEFLSNGAYAVFCFGYSWDDVYGTP